MSHTRGIQSHLADMDRDNHIAMIMRTIWHEYAPTVNSLGAYPHHKVKSTHNHKRVTFLTMGVHRTRCTTSHEQANIYIYIHHAQCKYTKQENKLDIANVPRTWPSKVHER